MINRSNLFFNYLLLFSHNFNSIEKFSQTILVAIFSSFCILQTVVFAFLLYFFNFSKFLLHNNHFSSLILFYFFLFHTLLTGNFLRAHLDQTLLHCNNINLLRYRSTINDSSWFLYQQNLCYINIIFARSSWDLFSIFVSTDLSNISSVVANPISLLNFFFS